MKNKSNWIKLGALGLSAVLPLSVAVKLESDRQTSVRDLHDVCRTLVPKKSYHSTGGIAELVGISKFHEIIFQNIPNADFKFRGIDIHVNSAGMRSYRDYPLEKSQGVFRIVVIGDSFTFGNGSNLEDAFPHVLEAFLNRNQWNNARYEVLNFGVSAYNSIQEAAVYENIARHYNPDLVIICAFHNDWWMPCGIRVPEGWKPGEEIDPSFFRDSCTSKAELISSGSATYLFRLPDWYLDHFSGTHTDIREAYERIRRATSGIPVVLTQAYHKLKSRLDHDEKQSSDFIFYVGKKLGFHIADPGPLFEDYVKRNDLEGMIDIELSLEDFHYRQEANMIMALTLLQALTEYNLVPGSQRLKEVFSDNIPFYEDVSPDFYSTSEQFNRADFDFDAKFFNRVRDIDFDDNRIYKSGEPINGRITIMNISDSPKGVMLNRKIRRKGYSAVGDKTLLMKLYKVGLGGEREVYYNWDGGLDERLKYVNVGIAPGASNAFNFSIPQQVVEGLEYGNYKLEIAYFGADPMSYRPCTKDIHFTVRSCKWQGPEHEMEMRKLHDELKERRKDISRKRNLKRGKDYSIKRGQISYIGF